jgi:hypothetical protein
MSLDLLTPVAGCVGDVISLVDRDTQVVMAKIRNPMQPTKMSMGHGRSWLPMNHVKPRSGLALEVMNDVMPFQQLREGFRNVDR